MIIKDFFLIAANQIIRCFHLRNYLVFEIEPGRTDSSEAVIRLMLEKGWNKMYHLAVLTNNPSGLSYLKDTHVHLIKTPKNTEDILNRIVVAYAKLRAKMIIDVNSQINKIVPDAIHLYLSHGSPLKSVKKYYRCTNDTDYMLCQSDFWKPINEDELGVPQDRQVALGLPRNDDLFSKKCDLKQLFGKEYDKVIAWYPTFRHHKSSAYRDGFSIPVIHSESKAREINELARKNNILLVIKPHPAQAITTITNLGLDNIIFIDETLFQKAGISSYEFLAKTDALITDYSSVVFDYLITRKPIALTFEDYNRYSEHNGFAIDTDILRGCADMLDEPSDFEYFFKNLIDKRDPYFEQREKVMMLTNKYIDAFSTQRTVDWIERLLENSKRGSL